jgi:solute carrier family 26, other
MVYTHRSFLHFSIYSLAHRGISPSVGKHFSAEKIVKNLGVFAVCSLMVGSVRLRLIPEPTTSVENGSVFEETTYPPGAVDVGYELTPMMVISSLTFVVGVVQVLMALCRLTFVTTYMTDQLVSGYTTGSAFHVLIAQFDKLFGVKIKHYEGVGMLFFVRLIFMQI